MMLNAYDPDIIVTADIEKQGRRRASHRTGD